VSSSRRWSPARLRRQVVLDVSPLRESRDFRLLMLGQLVSSTGSQIALVALPTQIFLLSHSGTTRRSLEASRSTSWR
jgi:hypothetical protein